jgi:hypothetical protein
MADRYIDYWEAGKYGAYFMEHARSLIGASPLVNIELLCSMMASAVSKMEAELDKMGIKRSSLRSGRDATTIATDTARKHIRRFFMHLGSLDDTANLDIEAFFPGYRLGDIATLEPAELGARMDDLLRAFAVPANRKLPQRETWKQTLTATRGALDDALSNKSQASRPPREGSTSLRQAHEEFFALYNGVAKPIVRGLLRSLGREHELELFFIDLQVSEAGRPAGHSPADTSAPAIPISVD